MKKIFLLIGVFALAGACNTEVINSTTTKVPAIPASSSTTNTDKIRISEPISNALSRITKKPFGIFITPKNSPVAPEKFTGFHTGVDFETTAAEANADVPITAACDGKLLVKKYASGYGGVAVQSCVVDKNAVTVIYGHLRFASIAKNIGDNLKAGDKIGVLGTGYSAETNGERKHLHFGVHKGTAINILGYVQKQADLSGWLNAEDYLK